MTLPRLSREDEVRFSSLAISLAQRCAPEKRPGRGIPPRVGAIVVGPDGEVISTGFRGERVPEDERQGKEQKSNGDHAEFVALFVRRGGTVPVGSTVFTTLEPCVRRGEGKEPCFERIQQAGVSRVYVGSLDPNPDVTGRGILKLRRAGIEVALFPHEAQVTCEELNSAFTAQYASVEDMFFSEVLNFSLGSYCRAEALAISYGGAAATLPGLLHSARAECEEQFEQLISVAKESTEQVLQALEDSNADELAGMMIGVLEGIGRLTPEAHQSALRVQEMRGALELQLDGGVPFQSTDEEG